MTANCNSQPDQIPPSVPADAPAPNGDAAWYLPATPPNRARFSWQLPAQSTLRLCLDAAQTLDRYDPRLQPMPTAVPPARMTLTLLTYCYARAILASEDVVQASYTDPVARYICGRHHPEWIALRRFRREHRDLLEQTLACVLQQTWARKFDEAEAEFGGYRWFEEELNAQIADEVRQRLETASLLDLEAAE